MLLKAIVIIPRIKGFFLLDQAEVYRSYLNFKGFTRTTAPAMRKGQGYGVALIQKSSQIDEDLGEKTLFLSQQEVNAITKAFDKSDKLTEDLVGHGWTGERSYQMLHHYCCAEEG